MNEWNILFFSHYNCFIQTTKNNSGKYAHHSYLMMRQQQQNALNLSATYTKKTRSHFVWIFNLKHDSVSWMWIYHYKDVQNKNSLCKLAYNTIWSLTHHHRLSKSQKKISFSHLFCYTSSVEQTLLSETGKVKSHENISRYSKKKLSQMNRVNGHLNQQK